ncbi:hypothetical protein [Gemmata sp.]|uniref:hypothetical protein n=1 Tax=Gemmata sp. TaxID=1914242 RepID=UPI003F7176F4
MTNPLPVVADWTAKLGRGNPPPGSPGGGPAVGGTATVAVAVTTPLTATAPVAVTATRAAVMASADDAPSWADPPTATVRSPGTATLPPEVVTRTDWPVPVPPTLMADTLENASPEYPVPDTLMLVPAAAVPVTVAVSPLAPRVTVSRPSANDVVTAGVARSSSCSRAAPRGLSRRDSGAAAGRNADVSRRRTAARTGMGRLRGGRRDGRARAGPDHRVVTRRS